MPAFKTFLPLDDDGYDVEVKYNHYAGCKGKRESGLQMEPDEPPSVEIEKVSTKDGVDLIGRLNKEQTEYLEELAMEDYHS